VLLPEALDLLGWLHASTMMFNARTARRAEAQRSKEKRERDDKTEIAVKTAMPCLTTETL
jgi:hypothetical protein